MEEVAGMTHEELRAHVSQTKDTYDKMRKFQFQLYQKHQRSVTREKRIVVDHQKQVLQAETLNMMTKYQLVFAKIECQVNRVLNSNKLRELKISQRAFDKMKKNAQVSHARESYMTHLIHLKLQSNLGVKMLSRFQTNRMRALRKGFEGWKLKCDAAKTIERLQIAIEAEMAQKKTQSTQLIQALKAKQEALNLEMTKQRELHQKHESVRQRILEAEEKLAQQENNARSRLSERSNDQSGADQNELELLREKEELHEQLLNENNKLKHNLNDCESNLSGFISEMNGLLDQHEMGSLLGQALMPQDPELAAISAGARPQVQQPSVQMQQNANAQDQQNYSLGEDQLYSSQHDSVNERPMQRTQLGETGGGSL